MRFHSRRERTLWLLAAGCTLAIYSTLGLVRTLTTFLRERGLLRLTLWALLALAVIAVLAWVVRGRPKAREWMVLGLVAAGYLLILPIAKVPEEKFHLLEYGFLGGVVYAALRERVRTREDSASVAAPLPASVGAALVAAPDRATTRVAPTLSLFLRHVPLTAFLLTTFLGLVDEILQGILPSRYYGTHDVILNALAAGLAIAGIWGREWARRPSTRPPAPRPLPPRAPRGAGDGTPRPSP